MSEIYINDRPLVTGGGFKYLITGHEFYKLEKIEFGMSGNMWHGCSRYRYDGKDWSGIK